MYCLSHIDGVPPDGTPVSVTMNIETAIIVVQCILTVISVFGIAVCLGFTIIYRKRKYVLATPFAGEYKFGMQINVNMCIRKCQ